MLGKKAESRNQQKKHETARGLAVAGGWLLTGAQSCSVVRAQDDLEQRCI